MEKFDYKKIHREFYSATSKPKLLVVPEFKYITISGEGNPNTSEMFSKAVQTLYPIAYTLKFMIKKGKTTLVPCDYTIMPLEGQWWADDMNNFITRNKDSWKWKIQLFMPEFITEELLKEAINAVKKKKDLEMLPHVKFEKIADGPSAQIMHIGSFDSEYPTIKTLHDFIEGNGKKLRGLHREIYLSDFRKTAPERLKTIIRQPFDI